ncbi:hypothetical protein PQI66_00975 [Corynebacterium sp. USCH3]|uniref:hypothetical protein n=1 Tax=Corynebacterium sp. USCH3 TaxID=3024840 RepID=UPI0030965ADF
MTVNDVSPGSALLTTGRLLSVVSDVRPGHLIRSDLVARPAQVPLYPLFNLVMPRGTGGKTAERDRRPGEVSAADARGSVTGITVVKAFGQVGRAHGRHRASAEAFFTSYFEWCKPLIRNAARGQAALRLVTLLDTPTLQVVNGVGSRHRGGGSRTDRRTTLEP